MNFEYRPPRRTRSWLVAATLLTAGIIIGFVVASDLGWLPRGHAVPDASSVAPSPPPIARPVSTAPQPMLGGSNQTFVDIAKSVKPAVVNIYATKSGRSEGSGSAPFDDPLFRKFFGDEFFRKFEHPKERKERGLGSGVIVESNGLIITNNHVVGKADEIRVTLSDKREFKAKLIGTDPKTDVAVVKIDATGLPTVAWADSDKLEVGEFVLAVGNPFGLTQTVTLGIVSALGRAAGIAEYEDFIQTDAAINPGNSGGALVNVRGELVGINTAIFSQSGGNMGIGFAVPSNMAQSIMGQLVQTGKVVRGWLGVSIQELTPELASQFGITETKGCSSAMSWMTARRKRPDSSVPTSSSSMTANTWIRRRICVMPSPKHRWGKKSRLNSFAIKRRKPSISPSWSSRNRCRKTAKMRRVGHADRGALQPRCPGLDRRVDEPIWTEAERAGCGDRSGQARDSGGRSRCPGGRYRSRSESSSGHVGQDFRARRRQTA
ncbi:MAG: trypsin-like peptidase domain-containing protein [Nitrospira sp.]